MGLSFIAGLQIFRIQLVKVKLILVFSVFDVNDFCKDMTITAVPEPHEEQNKQLSLTLSH